MHVYIFQQRYWLSNLFEKVISPGKQPSDKLILNGIDRDPVEAPLLLLVAFVLQENFYSFNSLIQTPTNYEPMTVSRFTRNAGDRCESFAIDF